MPPSGALGAGISSSQPETRVQELDQEDLGTAAVIIDWASAKHETQYTRLFRS